MRKIQTLMMYAWVTTAFATLCVGQSIPTVYEFEDTGAEFPEPGLPEFDRLPIVRPLPDPFAWSDGNGRSEDFKDWSRCRSEIKAEIEHYEIGSKPPVPQQTIASCEASTLIVKVIENDETLGKTSRAWFIEDMFRFGNTVEKLPYDHHEFMAMVAPRALLVLGNPDFEWLADESGYVSCRATHEVWKTCGIGDRFGFSIVGGHPHCRLSDIQRPDVEAFVDKIFITTYPFGPSGLEAHNDEAELGLKDAVGGRFKIGVGVSHQVLKNASDAQLINKHFQILTPENCMKPQGIHPAEDRWDFEATDAFAEFVRMNELEMVGHCLVWAKDDRTDQWMMQDGDQPVSREKLLRRIETHVNTVVKRYAKEATQWDVVNEAIGDNNEGLLRDSVYSRASGIDFIVTAFKAARAADPDALLIYNDYNGHKPDKRKKLIELLTKLKAAGAPVDAYGMQGHFELGDTSLAELRETFDALRQLDIKVIVSELDIDVVTRGRWWAEDGKFREELKTFDPYRDGMPPEIEQQMVDQYVRLFELFDEYSDTIARVSFWNLHDGQSWLNYFPWQRVNHPLLFDRNRQPKAAYHAVYKLLTNAAAKPQVNLPAHLPFPRNDANSREAHRQLLSKTKKGQIDVYFQGDSITRRWGATDYPKLLAHWRKNFHGWNAANFAWGGDNTHHMLWRMQNGELDGISPKVVCIQAGANNLPWTGPATDAQVEDVVGGIRAMITEFRSRFPDAQIVLTAMFPRDQNPDLASTIDSINSKLEAMSTADPRIHWLNINQGLVGPDAKLLPAVSSDGIHLEEAGYEVWAQGLRPLLTSLLGPPAKDDNAPPPTGDPGLSK